MFSFRGIAIVNPQYEDIFSQFPGQVTLELVPWELQSQPGGAAAVLLLCSAEPGGPAAASLFHE